MGSKGYTSDRIVAAADALEGCGLPHGALAATRVFRRAPRSKVWHGDPALTHPNPMFRYQAGCSQADKLPEGAVERVSSLVEMAHAGERLCTTAGCLPEDARFVLDYNAPAASAVLEVRAAARARQAPALAAALSRVKQLGAESWWAKGRYPELFATRDTLLEGCVKEFDDLLVELRASPAALRRYYTPEVHPARDQCDQLAAPEGVPAWAVVAAAHSRWSAATLDGEDPAAAAAAALRAACDALAPIAQLHPDLAVPAERVAAACAAWCQRWESELDATAAAGADRPWQLVAGELHEWGTATLGENHATWLAEAHRVFGGHVKEMARRRLVLVAVPMVLAERVAEACRDQTRGRPRLLGPAGDDPAALAHLAAALWDPAERRGPARRVDEALTAARLIDQIA